MIPRLGRIIARLRGFLGESGYDYGWPAGGSSEPDVIAQWTLTELSGNIVDQVGPYTLDATSSPSGYNQEATGVWAKLSPGIKATGGSWADQSPPAALAPLTSDWTWEWVLKCETISANEMVCESDISNADGWQCFYAKAATKLRNYMVSGSSTIIDVQFYSITDTSNDGEFHKWRMLHDRDGNIELFLDGISQGTVDMTSQEGENINIQTYSILGSRTGSFPMKDATMLEFRQSHNITNNSGGPGGG